MDRHWSIVTTTRSGNVSIIRDLTEREARALYEKLDPMYGVSWTQDVYKDDERILITGGHVRLCSDGDIEERLVLGPPGWDEKEVRSWGGNWPKITSVYVDKYGKPLDPQPTD